MEMKLEARAAGAIFALSAGDDRLREGAGVATETTRRRPAPSRTAASSTAWQNAGQVDAG